MSVAAWGAIFKPPGAAAAAMAEAQRHKRKAPAAAARGTQQYSLDFGQTRNFGPTKCTTCGMEYTQSQPDDEAAHKKFHEKFVNGAPMPECKSESVVQRLADGSRIILIRASSEVQLGRVRTAIELMQPDIGAVTLPPNYSVLLRISAPTGSAKPGSLRLQGAVIAQPLQRASGRVLPNDDSAQALRHDGCAEGAVCGISHIWVHKSARLQGVATSLLSAVCQHMASFTVLPKEQLAFCQPTAGGRALAASFVGNEAFLVYDGDEEGADVAAKRARA